MKRPAFQFYPADWRNDAGLRLCSVSARGLWIDMLCVMHAAEPYGHLCAAGRPLGAADLAKIVGESERNVTKWLDEIIKNNVCSLDNGVLISRRMVRDERLRQKRAEGGSAGAEHGIKGKEFGVLGGRPANQEAGKEPPFNPPPSSSSSSSSSKLKTLRAKARDEGRFPEFWNSWPSTDRKTDRKKCLGRWFLAKLDDSADEILAHIEAMKLTRKWTEGYEPAPLRYLSGEQWKDGVVVQAQDRFAGAI